MRLVGVGVGPGDPDLVTVKAVEVMRAAAAVFVPVTDTGEIGRAEAIVLAHIDPVRVRRLRFAIHEDAQGARRSQAWDAAAGEVADVLRRLDGPAGGSVAFATIGDPNVYSTFTYLAATVRERLPGVTVETVPGITAMQDLAARSGTVLVEGTETLALLPFTAGEGVLDTALRDFDTVVCYKGGRRIDAVLDVVGRAGRLDDVVYGARLGLAEQDIRSGGRDLPRPAHYLSTLLVPARRDRRGGKL